MLLGGHLFSVFGRDRALRILMGTEHNSWRIGFIHE
jgi:hypothetical protein